MSAWATTWAYEQDVAPCGKKSVLVALAHFADEQGYCYPSQETLAGMTAQGVSTVRNHLDVLENTDKLIVRNHRYTEKGKRTSDGFYLQAPAERLRPPSYRRKPAVEKSLPPDFEATTASEPDLLPPNAGDDLSVDQLERDQSDKGSQPDKRGSRINRNFQPDGSIYEWARTHAPHVNITKARDEFVDYWIDIPGRAALKLNWQSTFRNRLRTLEARTTQNAANQRSNSGRPDAAGTNSETSGPSYDPFKDQRAV